MSTVVAALLAIALAFAGMGTLSAAMDRHFDRFTRRHDLPAARRVPLRALGGVLIALALAPCVLAWGASVGVVAWLGFLGVGALGLVALLSYLQSAVALTVAAAAIAGVLGLALSAAWPLPMVS